ncbi:MAG: CysS/YqeB C-terminal domain-containing protein [Acidimicrobiales bacterium]
MSEAATARILTIMGSGETSPTMVKTHREILDLLGPAPVPAVFLDTPFGFQENAAELSAKTQAYFAESLSTQIEVAGFRSGRQVGSLAYEQMLTQVRRARYVFAGPGSPSYALEQWSGTELPRLLSDKLNSGGAVTFASAAALTLGVACVPVYEIYKVGQDPHWLAGMDLLGRFGLDVAVIPHYNNAEGTNHDTRFCYLGERRLAAMETDLASGVFVLGVDEHTGLVLDLDSGSARVVGLGVVTVRAGGRSQTYPAGSTTTIEALAQRARELDQGVDLSTGAIGAPHAPNGEVPEGDGRPHSPQAQAPGTAQSPFRIVVREFGQKFDTNLKARDVPGATAAMLSLESEIRAWGADTLQSDDNDVARSELRHMMVAMGELAEMGAIDPRLELGPIVELVIAERDAARSEHRWSDADVIRDRLLDTGIEIHDTPDGTQWSFNARPATMTGPPGQAEQA